MPKHRRHRTEGEIDIDRHVGARLRLRRTLMGVNQSRLGNVAGLTFQQIRKYENGANRVSASKLYLFASVLKAPVSFFFEGMEFKPRGTRRGTRQEKDPLYKRETLEFVRPFARISDPAVRRSLTSLILATAARNDQSGTRARRRILLNRRARWYEKPVLYSVAFWGFDLHVESVARDINVQSQMSHETDGHEGFAGGRLPIAHWRSSADPVNSNSPWAILDLVGDAT